MSSGGLATMYMLGTLCKGCHRGRMTYVGAPVGMLKCSFCPDMCKDKVTLSLVDVDEEEEEGSTFNFWGPYFGWKEMRCDG